jgi:hypothetical protein
LSYLPKVINIGRESSKKIPSELSLILSKPLVQLPVNFLTSFKTQGETKDDITLVMVFIVFRYLSFFVDDNNYIEVGIGIL